jgi:hypothetical protein
MTALSWVTRLGEFLPIGWLFSWWNFFTKITQVAQLHIWTIFFHGTFYGSSFTKMGWAIFWVFFPPTHLVTLAVSNEALICQVEPFLSL